MARGKGKKGDRRGTKGFTSIELIVVILALGILTATIIVKNPFRVQDYSAIAADQLIADIRLVQAKSMGLKSAQSITFFVNSLDHGIYDVAGVQKKLPKDITVTNIGTITNPLRFNTLGAPLSNGIIQLSGGSKITVYDVTGKAEWSE